MSAREELSNAVRDFWTAHADLRKTLRSAAGRKYVTGSYGECLAKAADTTPARRAGKECASKAGLASKYSSAWGA